MYADPEKYFLSEPENIKHFEIYCKRKGAIFDNNKELIQVLLNDCDNNSPNWCFIGIDRFLKLCKEFKYKIINKDLDIDKTNPLTLFTKL